MSRRGGLCRPLRLSYSLPALTMMRSPFSDTNGRHKGQIKGHRKKKKKKKKRARERQKMRQRIRLKPPASNKTKMDTDKRNRPKGHNADEKGKKETEKDRSGDGERLPQRKTIGHKKTTIIPLPRDASERFINALLRGTLNERRSGGSLP
ncbi:hypothetical protein PLICRDRAFT_386514 [Plicaturopsis crispa FD-325 SS-3]|nr:hypothetical protein PLICRDRAFT_386514 [Plicaturopsis crispa FD-325 SS-3]